MNAPTLLECPSCGAPVRFRIAFCDYCRVPLHWGQTIPLERGGAIHAERYPSDPLMGASKLRGQRIERTPDGHLAFVPAGMAFHALSNVEVRDLCIAVEGTTYDAHAGFGVVVRAHTEGSVMDTYAAVVVPSFRSVRLSRIVEGGAIAASEALRDWESAPEVRPMGEPNTLEVRCADTMLQVFVNGICLMDVVDAGLGFGAFGWRAISLEAPARVLLHGLSAFHVARGR